MSKVIEVIFVLTSEGKFDMLMMFYFWKWVVVHTIFFCKKSWVAYFSFAYFNVGIQISILKIALKKWIRSTIKNEKSPWKNRCLNFSFFVLHSPLYTFLFQHTIHFYYILFLSNYVKQLSSKRLCATTLYTQDLS